MPSESRADEMSSIASSSNCDHRTSMESLNSSHDETSRPRKISYDATEYVQKARVTKAAPPPPAYNPMQFVATKPVKLYQTAQEQAKRAEELKKTKEVKKEDAEEWQSNLDNWKSSRRKRVEHIIDRVVEVKKLELVDHDRNRKKSKTLSEMMEQRGGKKKINVPIYTEDENNDFSDLGIGTSSTSGKSSLSEDGDNHSVMSDNQEAKSEKSLDLDQGSNSNGEGRGYISSPGYDTSSSNAPASSPDPSEYTYEAAIQNYKNRVSMASQSARKQQPEMFSKDSTPERSEYVARKRNFCFKIEDRLLTMEMKANGNELEEKEPSVKKDLPKVDISKRRELFEKQQVESSAVVKTVKEEVKVRSIKERMSSLELSKHEIEKRELKEELPFEIPSIRERFVILEKKVTAPEKPRTEVLVSASVKERLSNLQSAAHKGPAVTVAASDEEEMSKSGFSVDEKKFESSENFYTDHEDSGFITTDVLSGVSHAIGSEPESDEHVNPRDDTCEDYQTNGLPVPDIVPRSEMQVAETPAVEVEPPKEDPDASVIEALEIAFQEIDNENDKHKSLKNSPKLIKDFDEILTIENDPIYENLDEILKDEPPPRVKIEPKSQPKTTALPKKSILKTRSVEKPERVVEESHYQVPTSEPYYEVPKTKPVPLYENFEMFGAASPMTLENKVLEPPKEKPPPPPVEVASDEHELAESEESEEPQAQFSQTEDVFKRVNSTKRIKKEIRSKRSSFLGIEGGDDDSFLEINVAPPPNMAVFLEEERRLQRQLLRKTGFSDSSDAGESRDSGVSENHSRQSSGPYSSEENDEKLHGQELVPSAVDSNIQELESAARLRTIEKQIRDQETTTNYHVFNTIQPSYDEVDSFDGEEVLRVERELLQLEEEELKRQRESMIYHEKLARSDLNHGAKMLKSANRMSAHEQSNGGLQHYSNLHYPHQHQAYQIETDYRKSMPDLQSIMDQKRMLPIPPAKPLRAQFHQDYININSLACMTPNSEHHETSNYGIAQPRLPPPQEDFYQIRNTPLHHMPQMRTQSCTSSNNNHNQYANMSKQTLHVLSATPKPKLTNDWVRRSDYSQDLYQEQDLYRKRDPYLRHHNVSRNSDTWAQNQQKRRSDPQGFSYNSHWLIQEAEQRRLEQQRNDRNVAQKKPLPDSVIQTITQRVQSLGLGERLRRPIETPMSVSNGDLSNLHNEQERVLSVSGKKRCSHCNNELGRGAAMIIESLRLFYHIDCFKCSVCHASLGDGLGGTDVRVRNSKLHCQNCYSSDDGIKFSCV